MSGYSELIKSFERVRDYMREFYVYGFKSRDEYVKRSARSYDDEKRRLQSWLGEYMGFARNADGKNVFLSIDSRVTYHNPLFRAFRTKSFTDFDITFHFLLLEILAEGEGLCASEIAERMDVLLAEISDGDTPDLSTLRKKLKEYAGLGVLKTKKIGNKVCYSLSEAPDLSGVRDMLDFFTEVAPLGVLGSFLLDRAGEESSVFSFKHHYITSALDSEVLAALLVAMSEKISVTAINRGRRGTRDKTFNLVPLRIFVSVQNGRQHLLAFVPETGRISSFRLDYLSEVKAGEPYPDFDALRARLDLLQKNMWGVNCLSGSLERVEFTVRVAPNESYIVSRLQREKRCGRVEPVAEGLYRFSAELYDLREIFPWIRTFISRIVDISMSNKAEERLFKRELAAMREMYG